MGALRGAKGELSTSQIATALLEADGHEEGARRTIARRVRGNLAYLEQRGKVAKTGDGRGSAGACRSGAITFRSSYFGVTLFLRAKTTRSSMSRPVRIAPHIVVDNRYAPSASFKARLLSVTAVALLALVWLLMVGQT